MAECYKCGIEGSKARLFDAITKEGIMHICDKCSQDEDIPVIKRPTEFQLKEAESPPKVYERLSNIAGIDATEHKKKISGIKTKEEEQLKKQETTLKDIVEKNYQKKYGDAEVKKRDDLIDNFHWIIMRTRRRKKLTQEQLANRISESTSAVKLAEQGILPDDSVILVNKLEGFLGIRIRKRDPNTELERPKELRFEDPNARNLTISDLKEMKAEQETKVMTQEIEEDISLNEEFKNKLEEVRKE